MISAGVVRLSSRSMFGPPTRISEPSTVARTPRPMAALKSVPRLRNVLACGCCPAAVTMARATGCSLSASAAAATASSSASDTPGIAVTAVTTWAPSVRVPVLSNRTTSMVRIRSRAIRSLIRTPDLAAFSVERAITSGMARPRACGQAMTSTVTVRVTASVGWPIAVHTIAVMIAATRANQNSRAAARSANAWAREEDSWASATIRWIPARVVSVPTAATFTRTVLSVATVPATTVSPAWRSTGFDSPVIIASSNSAVPSRMVPSAGTRAPARTSTTSPTANSVVGTVMVSPSTTFSASSGSRAASASKAEEAAPRARISIQWPSSMMTTSSASSHQKSSIRSPMPRVVTQEATKATVMAIAISSIIPGWRARNSVSPPFRKGMPP